MQPITVVLFAEHCVRAGQSVPVGRDEEIDLESPDYWIWTGTRDELRDRASEILLELATSSIYTCRCAHSVLDAIGYDWLWRLRVMPGRDNSGQFLSMWDDDGEPVFSPDDKIAAVFTSKKGADVYCVDNTIAEPFASPRY